MSEAVRTIVLKLHKPSSKKRSIIKEAMKNYSSAFQFLLDTAKADIENIKENYIDSNKKFRALTLKSWISEDLTRKLNEFNIEPFKDSIKLDFAAAIAGYLNLKQKNEPANYPCAYVSEEQFESEYDKLQSSAMIDQESFNILERKMNKLIYRYEKLRPIFFCRYSFNRNYSLLYDPKKNRYYVKMYLMNSKSDKREKPGFSDKKLYYIDKENKQFYERGSKRSFIIVPLSFGKWQERFLIEAREKPSILKTARLMESKGQYYLALNIIKPAQECVEPINFMGICRGIYNTINYSIVDGNAEVILSESINFSFDRNKIYGTINSIIETARKYRCQIIAQRLDEISDKLYWEDKELASYKPELSKTQYNKIISALNSKLKENGLPNIIRGSSLGIFYTCPECGNFSSKNRFSSKLLICVGCGATYDVEKAGSINLARKITRYKKDKIPIKVINTEKGILFSNDIIDFNFYPSNPYDCAEEFKAKMLETINRFHENIQKEAKRSDFKKKYSFIKKLENKNNILELIRLMT